MRSVLSVTHPSTKISDTPTIEICWKRNRRRKHWVVNCVHSTLNFVFLSLSLDNSREVLQFVREQFSFFCALSSQHFIVSFCSFKKMTTKKSETIAGKIWPRLELTESATKIVVPFTMKKWIGLNSLLSSLCVCFFIYLVSYSKRVHAQNTLIYTQATNTPSICILSLILFFSHLVFVFFFFFFFSPTIALFFVDSSCFLHFLSH